MKRILSAVLTVIFCCSLLTACQEVEYTTGVEYKIYQNGEGEAITDLISFYATAEEKNDGAWKYEYDSELFEVFLSNEDIKETGFTQKNLKICYDTLVLKPISEGEGSVEYTLTDSNGEVKDTKTFNLSVKKDDNGIFRIAISE